MLKNLLIRIVLLFIRRGKMIKDYIKRVSQKSEHPQVGDVYELEVPVTENTAYPVKIEIEKDSVGNIIPIIKDINGSQGLAIRNSGSLIILNQMLSNVLFEIICEFEKGEE